MTVTFFGHSDTPTSVQPCLYRLLKNLIVEKGATRFLVGHHGAFDRLVQYTLENLLREHPDIDYAVVLAYPPHIGCNTPRSIYPEGLETVPYRFAICKRNVWMIEQSDLVVTYVTRGFGGAAQFKRYAETQGKRVMNLAES